MHRLFVALLCCALLTGAGWVKAEPWRIVEPEQQLIVLYDQDARDLPARAEDIVGISDAAYTTTRSDSVRQRLGDPDNARFLIDQRMDEELRRFWSIDDVEERLQRYVVLDYPNEAAAEAAFRRLSRERNVISVEFNGRVELSATPNEPWFAPDFSGQSEFEYQWGIHDTLNLPGAWDITRGTAYVGLPDTGIQINHPDLSQAFRPQFAKMSSAPVGRLQ